MGTIIKPDCVEGFCNTTQSSYGNNSIVRLFNSNTTTFFLVTRFSNSTTTVVTVSIAPNT